MTLLQTTVEPSFGRLFDELFTSKSAKIGSNRTATLPKVNIRENEDQYLLEMAAPGLTKSDFKVQLDNDLLIISSEREDSTDDENYARREFSFQSFRRSFTLPDTADSDQIDASYENGILNFTIPKKEEAKPKPARSISIS